MSMRTWRIVLATAGILLLLYGAVSLLTNVDFGTLLLLALWLIGAVVIHDGIVSPLVIGVGWALHRVVPPRARRYLQGGLIAAALITVVAIPMIAQQGALPASKGLLQQNFGGNLTLLLGIVGAVSLLLYAVRVARDGRRRVR
ncbi:MAG: hypothetical protein ABJA89_12615 [Lapillicoccus sp.]